MGDGDDDQGDAQLTGASRSPTSGELLGQVEYRGGRPHSRTRSLLRGPLQDAAKRRELLAGTEGVGGITVEKPQQLPGLLRLPAGDVLGGDRHHGHGEVDWISEPVNDSVRVSRSTVLEERRMRLGRRGRQFSPLHEHPSIAWAPGGRARPDIPVDPQRQLVNGVGDTEIGATGRAVRGVDRYQHLSEAAELGAVPFDEHRQVRIPGHDR
jgi:hypothetical protein